MTALVDPANAQWLMTDALRAVREEPTTRARWGTSAIVIERVTGIATGSAAAAEADRQLAFLGRGPFVIDVHQIVGTDWLGRLGQVVTLTIDQLGYGDGIDVFVLEAEVDHASGISTIAVLRPLA